MSWNRSLAVVATLFALSPVSFSQSNSQDQAIEQIRKELAELRRENSELRNQMQGLQSSPSAKSNFDLTREIQELSARLDGGSQQAKPMHADNSFKLTGELRERGEWRDHTNRTDSLRILSRLTLNMDWKVSDDVKVVASLRDSRIFGDAVQSEGAGVISNTGNVNVLDTTSDDTAPEFHQVYAWIRDFMGTGWNAKIGRQEMEFGAGRLIGSENWSNVGRSFEGLRLDGNLDEWNYSFFAMLIDESPTNDSLSRSTRFYGLYTTYPLAGDQLSMDVYALLLLDDETENHLQTFGGRFWGKMENFDYEFEIAGQQNSSLDQTDIDFNDAYMVHGNLGIGLDEFDGAPRIGLVYDMGSTMMNNLFPTNHAKFSQSDVISNVRNLVHTAVTVDIGVFDDWRFGAEYHWHRAFQQAGSNDLGTEADLTLKGKCGENVWTKIAVGRHFGEDGLAARGVDATYITPVSGAGYQNSTFAYLQFTIPF